MPLRNEIQRITITGNPDGGRFRLLFDGQSEVFDFNQNNAAIKSGMEALSNIGSGNLTVTGGQLPGNYVDVEFSGGVVAATNVAEMTFSINTLSKTAPSVVIETTTEGSAPTSAVDEQQEFMLLGSPTGGSFTAAISGYGSTPTIAFDADNAAIEAAFELMGITFGATVTGGHLPDSPVQVEMILGGTDFSQMTIDPSGLTGGGISATITTSQEGGGGGNEIQTVSLFGSPTSGSFDITYSGQTVSVNVDADATAFEAALEGLSNIDDVIVSGGPFPNTPMTVEFSGSLANTNVSLMTIDPALISGSAVSASVFTLTEGVSGGSNEVQRLTETGSPSQGTFTLTYSGYTTTPISYNASAATVDAALEALSNIGSGNVTCSGGPLPDSPVMITFTGALAATNVSQITVNDYDLLSLVEETTPGSAGTNEIQQLTTTGTPTQGTFTLTYDGQTTSALNFNASAAEVDTALEALSNIGDGDVTCTGGPLPTAIDIEFQGSLSATNVSELVVNDDLMQYAVSTLQDGSAGTAGVDEVQEITLAPDVTGGTFTLTFGSGNSINEQQEMTLYGSPTGGTFAATVPTVGTTPPIAFNADNTEIENAFETIGVLTAVAITGGPLPDSPVQVEFTDPGGTDREQITIDTSNLTGGSIAALIETTQDGVAGGGANETQTLQFLGAPTGSFRLQFAGYQTSDIPMAGDDADVEAALQALPSVGVGNVAVTGGALYSQTLTIEFVGELANTNLQEIDLDPTSPLVGGTSYPEVTTTTEGSGGNNEIQSLAIIGGCYLGSMYLSFNGSGVGGGVPCNATAAEFQAIFELCAAVGTGNVSCTGGPLPNIPIDIEFIGSLSNTDVPQITLLDYTELIHLIQTTNNGTSPNGSWTLRTSALSTGLTSVAYGNGLFVAVSYAQTVQTSPDAITWTSQAAAGANNWRSVTYGNGLFVAVSGDGTHRVMTSPDGINWTARTAASAQQWNSVVYGGDRFVAIALNGGMYSLDGINWTNTSSGLNNGHEWYALTYGNGLFVATAHVEVGTTGAATSADGVNWTNEDVPANKQWDCVTYGNGLFVAIANFSSDNQRVMTSPDGINWTLRSAFGGNYWSAVTYGNGMFIAVSAAAGEPRVLVSLNGINWSQQSGVGDKYWYDVCFGDGKFVAVGEAQTGPANENVMTASGSGTNEIQQLTTTGTPTQGTFALIYSGQTTTALDFDATAAEVDAALEALSNIGAGDVTCTGGPLPAAINIEFTGALAATDVSEITVNDDAMQWSVTTLQEGSATGNETAAIDHDATSADVFNALIALPALEYADLVVTGGPLPDTPVSVQFTGATWGEQDVDELTGDASGLTQDPITGTITTIQQGGGFVNFYLLLGVG